MLFWTTLVYDVLAYWTWGQAGWSNQLGGLDFAGGTPGGYFRTRLCKIFVIYNHEERIDLKLQFTSLPAQLL